jgi:hypothetical protein
MAFPLPSNVRNFLSSLSVRTSCGVQLVDDSDFNLSDWVIESVVKTVEVFENEFPSAY